MQHPNLLEQLTGVDLTDPAQAAAIGAAFAAVIVAGQAAFKIRRALHRAAVTRRRERAPRRPIRPDMIATVIGAVIVLALSIEGMWQFFTGIGMPILGRVAFAAVFEICLIAVALRARHIRLLRQARRDELLDRREQAEDTTELDAQIDAIRLRGLNDFLVWVFAGIIGTLAALEAPTDHEQVARFIVPFIAAGMWELALGADVEDQRVTAVARHWVDRLKAAAAAVGRAFVRVAIHFGWVPPTSANASAQFREKLMTRLVSVCHQIHSVAEVTPKLLEQQRGLILDLQARGQWTAETMTELAQRLDALYRAVELTAPAAVRPASKPLPAPKPAPSLPAAPVPLVVPPQRRRRPGASKLDLDAIAAEYKRLYRELGERPSVRKLGAAGATDDGSDARWSKSSAHQWMKTADLAALEAEALAETEGASA